MKHSSLATRPRPTVPDNRFERLAQASIALSKLAPTLSEIAATLASGAQQQARQSQLICTQASRMAVELECAIENLNNSSHSVRDIVSTIKRVADQTRILSINASIEAARAGEFGRAFGAVAQEVQNLSGQTMNATGEISSRVEVIQGNIRAAVDAAGLDNQHLDQRRKNSKDAFSIRQLSSDMAEMARIATETAGAASNVDGISANIRKLCEELLLEVGTFRTPAHEKSVALFRQILGRPELANGSRGTMEALLREALHQLRIFEVAYATDIRGRQIISNVWADGRDGAGAFQADWSQRAWFRDVVTSGEISVSDIYRSKATDSFCFTLSGPIFDTSGNLSGVLAADVNFAELLAI